MSDQQPQDLYLRSHQEAFRTELAAAIRHCCPRDAERVLDCPCGDGFYTQLLASHLTSGTLVATDTSAACLARAREAVGAAAPELTVSFDEADAYELPYEDGSFDFVWCAQSFISLEDPVRALREFARVARRGATVAVLETDEFHYVLLPWPVELELAVFRAVRAESRARYGTAEKFSQARGIRGAFIEAGLTPKGRRTVAADRSAPFGATDREFLVRHFEHLREFVRPELTSREMESLTRETDPKGGESLLRRADSEFTCLTTISLATKMV